MDETSEVSNCIDEGQDQQEIEPVEEMAEPTVDTAEAEPADVVSTEEVPAKAVRGLYAMTPLYDILDTTYKNALSYLTSMSTRYAREMSHLLVLKTILPFHEVPEGTSVLVYDWEEKVNLHITMLWDPGLIGEIEGAFEQAGWKQVYCHLPTEEVPVCDVEFSREDPSAYVSIVFDAKREHSMCRLEDTGETITRVIKETTHKYRIICD